MLKTAASTILVLFYIIFASFAFAEQACKKEDATKDKEAWNRSASLGFNLTQGNSETTLASFGFKVDREKQISIWRFEVEERYGDKESETNVDYTKGLAEYKRLQTERWYVGFGVSAIRDEIADVKYRIASSPVLGYFPIKSETAKVNIEIGPAYVYEKLGDVKDDYLAPKFSERFEYRLSDTAKFFQSVSYMISVDDSDRYLVEGEAGVEARITTMLSLIASLKDAYDNQPAVGKERNDLTVLTSLGVHF